MNWMILFLAAVVVIYILAFTFTHFITLFSWILAIGAIVGVVFGIRWAFSRG